MESLSMERKNCQKKSLRISSKYMHHKHLFEMLAIRLNIPFMIFSSFFEMLISLASVWSVHDVWATCTNLSQNKQVPITN